VSVGVATLQGEDMSHSELIERADDRLYMAKRKGRNRTESALFD
jgi:diguanylate cyclase (GGDEF)-like protein